MNGHRSKPLYRRPLNLAWRPAIERLDQAVDRFLELRNLEAMRWQRYELFGVRCEPKPHNQGGQPQ
jgi:hypothetical protein